MKRLAPAGLVLVLLAASALPARADRFAVSLTSGIFIPSMRDFRQIYGSPIPLAVTASWTMASGLGFSLGVEYFNKSGRTIGGDETLPLRFRMWTVPVSVGYERDRGWIRYAAGLGLSFNSYKETWQVPGLESLTAASRRAGCLAVLSVEFPFASRFAARAGIRYMTLSTNTKTCQGRIINLGGTSLQIGVSYSFAAGDAAGVADSRRRSHER